MITAIAAAIRLANTNVPNERVEAVVPLIVCPLITIVLVFSTVGLKT